MAKNRSSFSEDIIKDFTFGETYNTITESNSNSIIMLDADTRFIPYSDDKLRLDLLTGEQKERLRESIIKNGIMQPIIVMIENGNYVILSGHNRVKIAKELNIKIPCIVKENISKEEADLIVIDTNILNRQLNDFKPSQLSYVLKVKADAEKSKEFDDDSKTSVKDIGKHYKLSKTQIFLYIRLNNLTDSLMSLLDKRVISLESAYNLSFILQGFQDIIFDYYSRNSLKLTKSITKELKNRFSTISEFNEEIANKIILDLMSSVTEPTKTNNSGSVTELVNFRQYIPNNISDDKIEDYIIQALKAYENKAGIN